MTAQVTVGALIKDGRVMDEKQIDTMFRSLSLLAPGQVIYMNRADDPREQEYQRRLAETARRYDKIAARKARWRRRMTALQNITRKPTP